MIINIRGTSGSGKSTIVRDALGFGARTSFREPLRKQPLGYLISNPGRAGNFCVLGHYESACGGCDTLPGYDRIFELVREGLGYAPNVIFEGLLVSEEVKRTRQLHADGFDVRVILLETPVEECLASIRARREARGDARPLKEDNTRNRVATIQRSCQKLEEAGVPVFRGSRVEAAFMVRQWLAGNLDCTGQQCEQCQDDPDCLGYCT